ncbi:unnamed protein product [Closterium sp. NIES-54]
MDVLSPCPLPPLPLLLSPSLQRRSQPLLPLVGDALTRALVIVKGGGGVGAWEGSKAGGAGSGGAARGGAGPRGTVVTQLRQHLH